MKLPCGEPPTASPPVTDDQPEQDSCRLLPPSGNTTSTVASPGATASAVMKSESARPLDPHETASPKITALAPTTRDPPDLAAARRRLVAAPLPTRGVSRNQTHLPAVSAATANICRMWL